ncbi:hypothetical protein WMY93_006963 [Mugilogobius chulae]|uniref:Uncharacterized protein n=1 Tax=Mugilogobius chulae TaxID=88201 RepID=A0AAW0PSN0_9GOBI
MTVLLGDTWPQFVPGCCACGEATVARVAFRCSSVVGLMPAHLPRLTALSPATCVQEAGCAIMSLARLPNMSRWCGRAQGPGLWCGHCPGAEREPASRTEHQLLTNYRGESILSRTEQPCSVRLEVEEA